MRRGIANQNHGMKEQDMLRLVEAFIASRLTCRPLHHLSGARKTEKPNYPQSVQTSPIALPTSTPTARVKALGLHNTLEGLTEAHLTDREENTPT